MTDELGNKNLLIISTEYYSFVKDQTESLAPFFPKIHVLVRHNPIAEISSIIPISFLVNFRKSYLIRDTNLPPNLSVIPTPVWYIPSDRFYRRLGEQHFQAVSNSIQRNDLHFDMVHAHATWSAGYVGAKLKEHYNVPFVITAHGYDIYALPFKDPAWRKQIEYVLNSSDAVITVSRKNLEYIRKLQVRTPVHVIPNGFRSDLFYPREMSDCRRVLGLPMDRKIVLTVGNLEAVKGQKYLVEAIGAIARKRKDILCVIIGMGGEKQALEKQIHSAGLNEYIQLAGAKKHEDIPVWINACDLFVLPSLNEGNPTVMFEALGCGKPFVGTKVGGVPEVITSEIYGLLVEQGDPCDLGEKILLALDREWDPESILEYASRFKWEKISNEIINVYKDVSG
jgi:glycosyltransferase involved in cell wall biosynthesis